MGVGGVGGHRVRLWKEGEGVCWWGSGEEGLGFKRGEIGGRGVLMAAGWSDIAVRLNLQPGPLTGTSAGVCWK